MPSEDIVRKNLILYSFYMVAYNAETCFQISSGFWCIVIPLGRNFFNNFVTLTAEALAGQVTQENYEKGMIYPPFSNIRKISAHIAANVAAKAYELGYSSLSLCPSLTHIVLSCACQQLILTW